MILTTGRTLGGLDDPWGPGGARKGLWGVSRPGHCHNRCCASRVTFVLMIVHASAPFGDLLCRSKVYSSVSHLPVTGCASEARVTGVNWRSNSYVSHLPVTGRAPDTVCFCVGRDRTVRATARRLPSSGHLHGSCALVGSSWPRDPGVSRGDGWDPTLGYPGEGPEGGTRILPIGTANITAWSSLLGSEILGKGVGDTFPGVWALQEHKLVGSGLKKARRHLDGAGWGSAFEPALVTPKLGRSSGAAVIWERTMVGEADVAAYTSTACGRHRLCRVTLVVGGLKIHVVSVYGDCRSQDATLAIVELCMGLVEPGDLWVIGGDFNIEASDMVRWLGGRGALEVIRPGTATCFSSGGDPTELDFFLVSPALRQLVVGCRAYEGTSLATHLPVVLHVAVGGTLQPLTRWIRPKCPGQAVLGRICGPVELVQDGLAALLDGPEWGGIVGGPPISQEQMDAGWAAWMRQACAEIHAATGADMDTAGDP